MRAAFCWAASRSAGGGRVVPARASVSTATDIAETNIALSVTVVLLALAGKSPVTEGVGPDGS
jgi:hypothetical protein